MRYTKKVIFIGLIKSFMFSNAVLALPFNIVPNGTLPTTVPIGGTVSATYTITNTTKLNPPYNLIKWLPLNTAVNPSITTCTPTNAFVLNHGASCTLGLTISGPINRDDPNSHQHLFVCMSDQATCAGPTPENSLNVIQGSPAFYVAAGAFGENTNQPGIARSTDGKTWTTETLSPPNFLYGSFQGVSCLNQLCVVGGLYSNFGSLNDNQPGIAVSRNAGVTWSQQAFTNLPTSPVSMDSGQLNGNDCTSQGCVLVGYFSSNTTFKNYAAIFTSTDETNWSYQALSLPVNVDDVVLNGINCDTGICVAVGNFLDHSSGIQHPGVAISPDRTNWTQIQLTLPSGYSEDASLNGVSCIQNSCVAAGNFTQDSTFNNFPGIVINTDNSQTTWAELVLSTLPEPPGITLVQGTLNGISCTTTACLAVGSYSDTFNNFYPAIAMSMDSQHIVWSQTALTELPSFSGIPMISGGFTGVTCAGTFCVAVGAYEDASFKQYLGVAYSMNNGNSWTQQVLSTAPLDNDELLGVS